MFETTGHVDRTVLVLWLVGKVSFHLSYEHYMGLQIGGKSKTCVNNQQKTRTGKTQQRRLLGTRPVDRSVM